MIDNQETFEILSHESFTIQDLHRLQDRDAFYDLRLSYDEVFSDSEDHSETELLDFMDAYKEALEECISSSSSKFAKLLDKGDVTANVRFFDNICIRVNKAIEYSGFEESFDYNEIKDLVHEEFQKKSREHSLKKFASR